MNINTYVCIYIYEHIILVLKLPGGLGGLNSPQFKFQPTQLRSLTDPWGSVSTPPPPPLAQYLVKLMKFYNKLYIFYMFLLIKLLIFKLQVA